MFVVIRFCQEESTPSDSVLSVYGPFATKKEAQKWADSKFDYTADYDNFRGTSIEKVDDPEQEIASA